MGERISFLPSSANVAERRASLVGRDTQVAELSEALLSVQKTGQTRAITVLGASGIGKTRLVRDFLLRARALSPSSRVFRGSARDQGPAYGLFARVLRSRFGITSGTDPEVARTQIRTQLSAVLEDRRVGDVAYFLGQIVDLEFPSSPLITAIASDASELRSLRRAVIKRFLEADAEAAPRENKAPEGEFSPLVLVFDDLHWADDDSLTMLAYLIDYVSAPVLLLGIGRPELLARRDDWFSRGPGKHHAIELSPLSEADATKILEELLAPAAHPSNENSENLLDLIDVGCTLGGGNPAMLEQTVQIFRDIGVLTVDDPLAENETWKIHTDKLSSVRVPMTVEDAVQARIASLSASERELLEHAAAMGSVFWLNGILAIERRTIAAPEFWEPRERPELIRTRAALQALAARDYILQLPDSTFAGDEEYVFKHNLEREALVKLTPPAISRGFHRAIADWLSGRDDVAGHEERLAMVARHWEKAENFGNAARAFFEAGDAARDRYANSVAVDHYAHGLALLETPTIEVETDRHLSALHHYGDALQSLGRNVGARSAFRLMLALAFRLGRHGKGGAAHDRLGRVARETGQFELAEKHFVAALSLFEKANDERGVASATDDLGKVFWLRGDHTRALEHIERALAIRQKLGDERSIALSLANLGLVYQDADQFQRAFVTFEQSLALRRKIGDLVGVATSLNHLGTLARKQEDLPRSLSLFNEAHEVAKEIGDRNRIAIALTNLGETYSRLGDTERAIALLKQAEELADDLGDRIGLAEAVRGLGKAYLARRDFSKARECTSRAVEIFRETGSRVQEAVALRSLGEVSVAGSAGSVGLAQGRHYLIQSISIFEEMGHHVELATTCRAYAHLLKTSAEFSSDPRVAEEAAIYTKRAEETLAKAQRELSKPSR